MDHRALGLALFRSALDQSRIAARATSTPAKQRGHARSYIQIEYPDFERMGVDYQHRPLFQNFLHIHFWITERQNLNNLVVSVGFARRCRPQRADVRLTEPSMPQVN